MVGELVFGETPIHGQWPVWKGYAPYAAFPLPEGVSIDGSLPLLKKIRQSLPAFASLVCGTSGEEMVGEIIARQKKSKTLFWIRGFDEEAFATASPIDQIGMAVTADDKGRGALRFMRDHDWRTPIEYARTHLAQQPELFLQYLLYQAAIFSAAENPPAYELFVGNIESVARTITDANIGQQDGRDDVVYSRINDAVSMVKDMRMAAKYPRAFALAHAVLAGKLGAFYADARYDTDRTSTAFAELLTEENLLTDDEISSDGVTIRGNIKPANALLLEALRNKSVREVVLRMALHRKVAAIDQMDNTVFLLDSIIKQALIPGSFETRSDVEDIIELVVETMQRQYDTVRARVYCTSPAQMDTITNGLTDRASQICATAQQSVRDRFEAYVRCSTYTMDHTDRRKATKEEYGDSPAGFIIRKFLALTKDALLYGAGHIHLVAAVDQREHSVRLATDEPALSDGVGIELQVSPLPMRAVLDVLDRAYKSQGGTLQSAGFHPEFVRSLANRTKQALSQWATPSEGEAQGRDRW